MRVVVMAAGLSGSGLAHAEPGHDCLYKFYNVTNNIGANLSQARSFLVQGEACLADPRVQSSPEYPAVLREAQKARAALEVAEKQLAARGEADAFFAEADALLQRLYKDDGYGFEKLQMEATALRKKAEEIGQRNSAVSLRARVFERIDVAIRDLAVRRRQAENRKHVARIRAAAVTARFPGRFSVEDSLRQDKIREAFLTASKDDYAVAVGGGAAYSPAVTDFEYRVRVSSMTTARPTRGAYVSEADRGGLEALYGTLSTTLTTDVPGLVWNVVSQREVIFVTIDGGRYRVDAMKVALAWLKPEAWPKTQEHEALLPADIRKLADVQALGGELWKNLENASEGYRACSDRIWKSYDKRFDAIRAQDIREQTRKIRMDQLGDKVRAKVARSCEGFKTKYARAFVAALDARNADRKKTADVVRAHMLELIARFTAKKPS
jgi:hypothetical protein